MDERPISEVLSEIIESQPRGTQARLARDLGVRPQTITKYLAGHVELPIDRWLEVERSLGLPELSLAERTGMLEAIPEAKSPNDPHRVDRWLSMFSDDPHERIEARRRVHSGDANATTSGNPPPLSRGERKKRWKEVGEAMRARLDEVGLERSQLAWFARLNDQFVGRILKGAPRAEPDPEHLRRLAAELAWTEDSIERLLRGEEPIVLTPGHPEYEARLQMLRDRALSLMLPKHRLDELLTRQEEDAEADSETEKNP